MHGFDHVLIAYTSWFFTLKIHIFMHLDTSPIHWVHPWYLIDLWNFKDNFWIFLNTFSTPLQSIENNFSTFYLADTSPTPSWSIETFSCQYRSTHWILKLNTSLIYQDCLYAHGTTLFISSTLSWISLWLHLIPFNFINLLVYGLNLSLFLFFMHFTHLRPRILKFWGFLKFLHAWALGLVN